MATNSKFQVETRKKARRQADESFVEVLKDKDNLGLREWAAFQLSNTEHDFVVDALLDVLRNRDDDGELRDQAAKSLDRIWSAHKITNDIRAAWRNSTGKVSDPKLDEAKEAAEIYKGEKEAAKRPRPLTSIPSVITRAEVHNLAEGLSLINRSAAPSGPIGPKGRRLSSRELQAPDARAEVRMEREGVWGDIPVVLGDQTPDLGDDKIKFIDAQNAAEPELFNRVQAAVGLPENAPSRPEVRANEILAVAPFVAMALGHTRAIPSLVGRRDADNRAVVEFVVRRIAALAGLSLAVKARQQQLSAEASALISNQGIFQEIYEAAKNVTEPHVVTYETSNPEGPVAADVASILPLFENLLMTLVVPIVGDQAKADIFETELSELVAKLGYDLDVMNVEVLAVASAKQIPSIALQWAKKKGAEENAFVSDNAAQLPQQRVKFLRLVIDDVPDAAAIALAVSKIDELTYQLLQATQNASDLATQASLAAIVVQLQAIRRFLVAA